MGCNHDERGFFEIDINQLMSRKKNLIEEILGYDKKPTKNDKRQMEIIDKQMIQELTNLKKKQFSNGESSNSNNSFYLSKKYEFETLTTQWEKLLNENDSIQLSNNGDEISGSFSSSKLSVDGDDNEKEAYQNDNNNHMNEDSEDDSSKFAREEYEKSCAEN